MDLENNSSPEVQRKVREKMSLLHSGKRVSGYQKECFSGYFEEVMENLNSFQIGWIFLVSTLLGFFMAAIAFPLVYTLDSVYDIKDHISQYILSGLVISLGTCLLVILNRVFIILGRARGELRSGVLSVNNRVFGGYTSYIKSLLYEKYNYSMRNTVLIAENIRLSNELLEMTALMAQKDLDHIETQSMLANMTKTWPKHLNVNPHIKKEEK